MMKKFLIAAIFMTGSFVFAQNASFGITGGFNYGATGDYENFSMFTEDASQIVKGKEKAGFHAGLYGQFELAGIFIRPELLYTELNTDYKDFDYALKKIDAPVLVGVNVIGPLNIKAGPSFQYILKNELQNTSFEIGEVDKQVTVGYQLGVGLQFGRLGFDARYEGAFSENDAFGEMANDNNFRIDSRPSQFILSLAYEL
ncbi:MAG: outer membrane beta-barrel protein [Bacteroidota bacterium]|nr:outer membrane beta-barrel protein [Christiangramia flava]MEE2772417.1 outer membrane beta-barrel protein [Bacteroidota bacterium]